MALLDGSVVGPLRVVLNVLHLRLVAPHRPVTPMLQNPGITPVQESLTALAGWPTLSFKGMRMRSAD
eukprot:2838121-Rhodomonas_salina.1